MWRRGTVRYAFARCYRLQTAGKTERRGEGPELFGRAAVPLLTIGSMLRHSLGCSCCLQTREKRTEGAAQLFVCAVGRALM